MLDTLVTSYYVQVTHQEMRQRTRTVYVDIVYVLQSAVAITFLPSTVYAFLLSVSTKFPIHTLEPVRRMFRKSGFWYL